MFWAGREQLIYAYNEYMLISGKLITRVVCKRWNPLVPRQVELDKAILLWPRVYTSQNTTFHTFEYINIANSHNLVF